MGSYTAICKLLATPNIRDERLKNVADKLSVRVTAMKYFDDDTGMLLIENANSYDQSTVSIARVDYTKLFQ